HDPPRPRRHARSHRRHAVRGAGGVGVWGLAADAVSGTAGRLGLSLLLTGGELVYRVTPSSEGRAIAAHRFNRVVIRRSRRKVHHRHAVDHVVETLIPPVWRFCLAIE